MMTNVFVNCANIVILFLAFTSPGHGHPQGIPKHLAQRNKEQTLCQFNEIPCRDGRCIERNLVCDGKLDCRDGSDENQEECSRLERTRKARAVHCKPLTSVSTRAVCEVGNKWVSCDHMVLPGNAAVVSCRKNYVFVRIPQFHRPRDMLTECNQNGRWEPPPLLCIPECGVSAIPVTKASEFPTIVDSARLPWFASLYKEAVDGFSKTFVCGASIIRSNLIVTAAQCVYDESTSSLENAEKLFVMGGSGIWSYDFPNHSQWTKKSQVKKIYIQCDYSGSQTNYHSDIALLELVEPMMNSESVLPICIDEADDNQRTPQEGDIGEVAGFFQSNELLQSLSLPYVTRQQCQRELSKYVKGSGENSVASDKFCAKYARVTSSTICKVGVGSGLAFRTDDGMWFLRGIASSCLKTVTGESNYMAMTNVQDYIPWIQDVVAHLEDQKTYPSCPLKTSRSAVNSAKTSQCSSPAIPANGEWQLPGCQDVGFCSVDEGLEMVPGSSLLLRCNPGYMLSSSAVVFCDARGQWSKIPSCTEIRCKPLTSASIQAECTYKNRDVSCDDPALPDTRVTMVCRENYSKDSTFTEKQKELVICNEFGRWNPEPIKCIPECGIPASASQPLIYNGMPANIAEFPWHATLYKTSTPGRYKEFACGATIIQPNLLVTAAHCVWDESTRSVDPAGNLFVAAGNKYRDYDSALNNDHFVKRSQVKNVYINCRYLGLSGNYDLDIALLELSVPLELSPLIRPVCMDFSNFGDQLTLELGAVGKVAGFGKANDEGMSSFILQTTMMPYIPYEQCREANNDIETQKFITDSKFCAGYNNGTAVCTGDSGGGLVFRTRDRWYLRGITSMGLGVQTDDGSRSCNRFNYSLYTRFSRYIPWIQEIMLLMEQRKPYPPCTVTQ